jgi:hypothetical protein
MAAISPSLAGRFSKPITPARRLPWPIRLARFANSLPPDAASA